MGVPVASCGSRTASPFPSYASVVPVVAAVSVPVACCTGRCAADNRRLAAVPTASTGFGVSPPQGSLVGRPGKMTIGRSWRIRCRLGRNRRSRGAAILGWDHFHHLKQS